MSGFLHGVETIEKTRGPQTVRTVTSGIIGLVGVAATGPVNALTLIQSPAQAAVFGAELPGTTIAQALKAIFAQGNGASVLVVNTAVLGTGAGGNLTAVVAESITITDAAAELANAPVGSIVVTSDPAGTTYVEGLDFKVSTFGKITLLAGTDITEGQDLLVSYNKFDTTKITASQIIGTISGAVYTGLQLFDLAFSQFGFTPRLLIAPDMEALSGVTSEMIVKADKYRAHAIFDAPAGQTPAQILAARGPLGTIPGFNSSSKRVIPLYPRLKALITATEEVGLVPYSPYYAGLVAANDFERGYWFSPSNIEIKGIEGVERILTAAYNDPNTDVNLLNAAGVVTVFNSFGTGIRVFGNRSAAYPSSTAPDNFIAVRRTADIIQTSVEFFAAQYLDRPINSALIDTIRQSVNQFLNTLVGRGAIVDGVCTYDPTKNPPVEIAAGHLTFDISFMPPTPAERITFDSFIDISLLNALNQI